MKNAQKPEKIHLGKLIEQIKKGRFVIPDFQREFDWQPWDVSELIKSIFMDYYIGTLLLWEGKKENYEKLSCKEIFAFEGESDPEYIVLDGQQRLTAIHYAFFQPKVNYRKRKNPFYYFIRIRSLLDENYDEAFFYYRKTKKYDELVNNQEEQFKHHIFPLGILKGGTWEVQQWILNYQNYWGERQKDDELSPDQVQEYQKYFDSCEQIRTVFFDILNDYQISYISLDEDIGIGKVCDIFTHINSKGVRLDTFDLLNAITRPKEIYLKDMYRKASELLEDDEYPGFALKTYILMVMSILEQRYCSPKYLYYLVPNEEKVIKKEDGKKEKIVLIDSKDAFVKRWDIAVSAIRNGLKSLKNPRDFGAINQKFLPYPSIIPVLSAIKQYVKDAKVDNKVDIHSKIRRWYWSSVFMNRYSSSVESTSTKDFMDLVKWFEDDDNELSSITEFYREYTNLDLRKENISSSAIYKAVFTLIILNGARDWETFDLPEYDSLDDHHIVPKSWGRDNGLKSKINTVLNRTALSPDTNRNVLRNKLPNHYMKEMFEKNKDADKVYEVLSTHLISRNAVDILLRDPFTVEDYEDFLEERKKAVIQKIEDLVIKEKLDLPEHLKSLDIRVETIELAIRDLIINNLSLDSIDDLKSNLPSHILKKITDRINREKRKNPTLAAEQEQKLSYWMSFSDFRELEMIIVSKKHWQNFEKHFGTKERFQSELSDVANLRNSIRHSRAVDKITKMKGEAALLWFEQQLKVGSKV